MTALVRLAVLCVVCLRVAIGIDLVDTVMKWASVSWGETNVTMTRDIALRNGFQSELHRLETDDGYIIHMTRIRGIRDFTERPKLPVLLMHGLLSSSDHWLLGGRGKDLPLLLAELGYDVWLGDWRGNTFSRGHKFMSTSDPNYWNFTYHLRAHHDLPAFIDRVLHVSRAPQLFYIGYSYGTTAVMVLGSEVPKYQSKIKQAILLAPVGYRLRDMHPKIQMAVDVVLNTYKTTTIRALFELLPREGLFFPLWRAACGSFQEACTKMLYYFFGQRGENIDQESFRALLPRLPSGASSLDLIYLAQIFTRGFRAYDFGKRTNQYVYGQKLPPDVPVEINTIPMALYYSPSDHLNSEEGVFELSRRLRNVTFVKKIGIANFSHLDYMIGKGVKEYLYDDIINLIVTLS